MPIDTSIYGNLLRPPKSVADYGAEMDNADFGRTRNLIAQGQLQDAQAARALAEKQRVLRSGWNSSTTDEARIADLQNIGDFTSADLIKNTLIKQKQGDAEIAFKKAQTTKETLAASADRIKQYRGALDFIDTPQGAARWLQSQYQDPLTADTMAALGPFEQAVTRIPQDPQQFQEWRQQAAMGMEKHLEAKRAEAKAAEDIRHNKAGEAVAQGQLKVAQGNLSLAGQRLAFEQNQPKGQYDADRGVIVDPRTGEAKPVTMGGQPLAPKKPSDQAQKVTDAQDVLSILDQAEPLVGKATGSYLGNILDEGARAVGASTSGAQSAAQLRALEGTLISKMPKMSGPQSDKDVLLYKQMAGQIGDPTIPAATKRAAMATIREIAQRNAGAAAPAPASSGGWTVKQVP